MEPIHATNRGTDPTVLRVDAKDLELGDSEYPRGRRYSVVTGVVSGIRELDGMPLIVGRP